MGETPHTLRFPLFAPCVVRRRSGASEELFPACALKLSGLKLIWEARLRTFASAVKRRNRISQNHNVTDDNALEKKKKKKTKGVGIQDGSASRGPVKWRV